MQLQIGTWRIAVEQIQPNRQQLADTYDQIADSWEHAITRLGYPAAYERLFARLVADGRLTNLKRQSPILDAGIGTAALSQALLKTTRSPLHVHGVDISPEMLTQAEENLRPLTPYLSMQEADVANLRYDDGTFSAVMAAHTLEHLSDPQQGLRELVRVLEPGAPLVLVISRQHLFSAWLRLKWAISRTTPNDLAACFTAAGLEDVKLYPLEGRPWCRWMSLACVGIKAEG